MSTRQPSEWRQAEWQQLNDPVIAAFRANGGILTGRRGRVLLVTTIGARSGQPRLTPLYYTTDGDRLVVLASKGAAPTHPAWYHNLLAHPAVTIERGPETFRARARPAAEPERTRLFAQHAAQYPFYVQLQQQVARRFPVIVFERLA